MEIEVELQGRWNKLWDRTGSKDSPFPKLLELYSEQNRHYHTLTHIKSCLDEFDHVRSQAENPAAVELAIWFHDAIYDTKKESSEEESAKLAREILTQAQLPGVLIDEVDRLIILTKTHQPSEDIDEQIMTDVDLSILGSQPEEYIQYKEGIRREYIHVPMYLFRKGRLRILNRFIDRIESDRLFFMPYFKAKNSNAKSNLLSEIGELQSMKVAVYAGSFDPPTNGHLYIINRARNLFDNLVVAIGENPEKKSPGGRFPIAERLNMLEEITADMPGVDVTSYPAKYLISFAQEIDSGYIVRGLRNEKDWQSESDFDEFNFGINPSVTTIFIRTPDILSRISSSFVMGLIGYPGWEEGVRTRVPRPVFEKIIAQNL